MIVKGAEKINSRPRATVARMPEPEAATVEQAPKRKRSRFPPDQALAAKRRRDLSPETRRMMSLGAKMANLKRWGTLNTLKTAEVPADKLPAVLARVGEVVTSGNYRTGGEQSAQRIDSEREAAIVSAAETSVHIVRAFSRIALSEAKDRVAAGRVVLAVAGLLDGQAAGKRAGDDGDPRDLDAGGLRRLALSAQARLSALEAARDAAELAPTHIPSDATSGAQAAQAVEPAQQSAPQAAPTAGKTPEPFE